MKQLIRLTVDRGKYITRNPGWVGTTGPMGPERNESSWRSPPLLGKFPSRPPAKPSPPDAYFQCNRCTAGCPLAPATDLTPAQVIHYLLLGDWGPALLNHRTSLI
jgi:hypothetical protein